MARSSSNVSCLRTYLKQLSNVSLGVLLTFLPQGQTYSAMSAPRCGAKVFIMSKFSVAKYLQYLDIYRITFMTTVPTILNSLTKYEHPERFNLKAIEVVTSGSSPLDAQLAASVAQKYLRSGVQVKQGWGMTETTCSVCGFSPDDDDDGRSIGWLNPNCAAKIVPIVEEEGGPDSSVDKSIGEIWVAGPQMMKGYWHRPDATHETVVEEDGYRWIRTGDIGYIDHRGCVYIVDRLKVC
jgi:4-coumarate--CoA ligase